LKYQKDEKQITVLCGGWKTNYGFEYLGNNFRYLSSNESEKYFVHLSGIIRENSSALFNGGKDG